jgi:hypothetical protein
MPGLDCNAIGIAIRPDGTIVVADCYPVHAECYSPYTAIWPDGIRVEGQNGPIAVVPAGVTPTLNTTWGHLKAIYR